jgi:hypothetical protein
MISRRLHIALTALAVLLPTASGAAESVGFVAAVRGFAEMRPAEGDFGMAALDQDVVVGDTIRTRRDGWLKMLLADDTTLAVDADSDLQVDRFSGTDGTHVTLRAGHVRTKLVDGFGQRVQMEMTTPHATLAARGTEWLTWLDADATWVCVVSGAVSIRAGGASIEIGAGDCAQAASGVHKASRPRHLRAVAMRPGVVNDENTFPAKSAGTDSPEPNPGSPELNPLLIDVNDLLRKPLPEDRAEGRPPASAAIP